ncbi:phage portal protein [Terribacillus sp. 7520-G]|uniref:phage portal protein n=1 Tax=Terribacillus sp. 7520-G TaxID=2025389 RepID=UPI000BA7CC41|nr:phage portal protein [Terribacillus sp. 7520-G]PAD39809.1 phage portal protein [Terribacillus sp. 7520-G]
MAFFKPYTPREPEDYDAPIIDAIISIANTDYGADYVSAKAIKNSDIFAAVSIIAQDIASSEIELRENGIAKENDDLSYLLNVKPNELTDAWHFKFAMIANTLLNGNSYARIIRDKQRNPVRLDFIPVSEMTVSVENNSKVVYVHKLDSKEIKYKSEDILHLKIFSTDGISGVSPLLSLKPELQQQQAGKKLLTTFFKRGAFSSGILSVKQSNLDNEARGSIRKKFEAANTGSSNAMATIVMDETMEYTPIEINTEVLNLVNNSIYSTKQIAKVFQVPFDRMGIETVNTSMETANLNYLTNTLTHYFKAFSAEMNVKLLSYPQNISTRLVFNADRLKEVDPVKKIDITAKKQQNGIFTVNESRKEYGLPPIPGGDVTLVSLNYVPLDMLGQIQKDKQNNNQPTVEGGGQDEGQRNSVSTH